MKKYCESARYEILSNLHRDRLYGEIRLEQDCLAIMRTEEFVRLHDISLSAIPPRTLSNRGEVSRAEHSFGVRHLADILGKNLLAVGKERELRNIKLAAFLHDIGTPPLSHLSEHFQEELLQKNHEKFAADVILNSKISDIIKKFGGEVDTVIRYIIGEDKPWSNLINGTIDLDNLDNSLRYGLGLGILAEKKYDPKKIVDGIRYHEGRIFFDSNVVDEVNKWDDCRREVYRFVYGKENLSSGAMFFRALSLACERGELHNGFFRMTDDAAIDFLQSKANADSRYLAESALKNNRYVLVSDLRYELNNDEKDLKKVYSNWRFRNNLADEIAKFLNLKRREVCVLAGWDKGVKKIDIPFIDKNNHESFLDNKRESYYFIKVFIDPRLDISGKIKEEGIGEIINSFSI